MRPLRRDASTASSFAAAGALLTISCGGAILDGGTDERAADVRFDGGADSFNDASALAPSCT